MDRPRCPVCGEDRNSQGEPFVSEWAVAAHVAGKIKYAGSDRLHKAWAREKVPDVSRSMSVPELAEKLMWAVHKELEASGLLDATSKGTPLSGIHDIEVQLHRHIKHRLQSHFGEDGYSWWVDGVPLSIRQDCACRMEADPARDESYAYTYLIDLKSILEKNWSLFESDFLRVRRLVSSKKDFLDMLCSLNDARNRHSHPVRSPKQNSKAFEEDLALVSQVAAVINEFCGSET